MHTRPEDSNVLPFPQQPIVFQLQSERFMEAIHALHARGFKISNTGRTNRFVIEDAKEPT